MSLFSIINFLSPPNCKGNELHFTQSQLILNKPSIFTSTLISTTTPTPPPPQSPPCLPVLRPAQVNTLLQIINMGCFLSTNSAAPPPKTSNSAASTQYNAGSKSPPPVDEETVKQVLSETPAIPKRPPPPVPRFHVSDKMLHQNGGAAKKPTAAFSSDDPSDVESEIRSSHSATGSDGALRWPRLNSRQLIHGEMRREKTAGRSPARRSDTSPSRVKPESGYSRKTGAGSGRRLMIRSGSESSKTGFDAGKSSRNHPGHVGFGSGGPGEAPTSNELLESSLVSLECFIFL